MNDDCPWISYAPGRREMWKCHHTRKAVRQAIAYGLPGLTIYSQGRTASGSAFFLEIPQSDWSNMFSAN